MNKQTLIGGIIFFTAYTSITTAAEVELQSHMEITNTVIQSVQEKLQSQENVEVIIEADPLDTRLRLSKCESPLQTNMPQNSNLISRFSVNVRCDSEKPWQVYIPVRVSKLANIYVSNSSLKKGDVIDENDLRLVKTNIDQLHTRPIFQANEIIGMVARRNIPVGGPFSERVLKLPTIVKKGDSVDITASSSGLNIRMTGEALSPGAFGQRIKVKNSSSKKTIEAIVIDAHTVQVSL